jgi:predicted PurR-regulated permease PerM
MFKIDESKRSLDDVAGLVGGVAAVVLAAIIIAMLYFGREIFVPIALAILLSFVLAPAVRFLEDWYAPRAVAVMSVVLLAFAVLFAAGGVVATQLAELANDLPGYQSTIRAKIQSIRGTTATSSTLERAADVLQDLGKELEKPKVEARPASRLKVGTGDVAPIPVEVRQPPPTALESLAKLISPLLHPLATTGLIVIFVIFILFQRQDLRNRMIKLAGSHDLQKTTAALDDAAQRLSRLFLTQVALNSAFGIVIGMGLWLIGVPSAMLWGILAAVLRFVPYIGAFIAAVFPLVLAAAVDPGWSMLIWTGLLFLTVEPLVGHVIEPLVYGHSTGLSPVAVVLAATFWTALWGPIGLVLAIPLTVCLVVLGRHVERLAFLDVMFGDRPALSPPEIFYQRMLAGDPAEAVEKAEEFLKEKPLSAYYDDVALKGLKLAQRDVAQARLDPSRVDKIKDTVGELIDNLADYEDRAPETGKTQDEASAAVETADQTRPRDLPVVRKEELAPGCEAETPILCVAGRNDVDEAVCRILAQLLTKHGLGAAVEGADSLTAANILRFRTEGVTSVCLSYLDVGSHAHMRYTIRRLRRRLPTATILLGCWLADGEPEALAASVKADGAVSTLREAVEFCLNAALDRSHKQTIDAGEAPLAATSAA